MRIIRKGKRFGICGADGTEVVVRFHKHGFKSLWQAETVLFWMEHDSLMYAEAGL